MSQFIADLHEQETPGREEFPRYDVEIVSPELPCGVGWLASALLELGVPLWKPWGLRDDALWERIGPARYRHVCPGSPWSRVVAGFVDGREVVFRRAPAPRFTHAGPGMLAPLPAAILFVRDPRDALFSGWRRARATGEIPLDVGFAAWAAAPYHHYPVSRARWLALFLALWRLELAGRPHLVLRFEDAKADPAGVLPRVLGFLGVDAGAAAVAAACACAEHARLTETEDRLLAGGIVASRLHAGGVPFEHRRHFTPAMAAALGGEFASVCAWLGYEPPAGDRASRPFAGIDVEALLRAMLGAGALAAGGERVASLRRRLAAVV